MDKAIVFLLAFAATIAAALGADWLLWKLWIWVLPQIWASGPSGFIRPGFWLFVAATTLLSWLLRGFVPSKTA